VTTVILSLSQGSPTEITGQIGKNLTISALLLND